MHISEDVIKTIMFNDGKNYDTIFFKNNAIITEVYKQSKILYFLSVNTKIRGGVALTGSILGFFKEMMHSPLSTYQQKMNSQGDRGTSEEIKSNSVPGVH